MFGLGSSTDLHQLVLSTSRRGTLYHLQNVEYVDKVTRRNEDRKMTTWKESILGS